MTLVDLWLFNVLWSNSGLVLGKLGVSPQLELNLFWFSAHTLSIQD